MQKVVFPQNGEILHREHLIKEQELISKKFQNWFQDLDFSYGVIRGGVVTYDTESRKLNIAETLAYDKQGNRILLPVSQVDVGEGQYKLVVRHRFTSRQENGISYMSNDHEILKRTTELESLDIRLAEVDARNQSNAMVRNKPYRYDASMPLFIPMPFIPGYFTNNSNGGFALDGPGANDVSAINEYIADNLIVCDGSAPNDPDSPRYNTANRHLPNLTNDRFLMGSSTSGDAGGQNNVVVPGHYHRRGTLTVLNNGTHRHPYSDSYSYSAGASSPGSVVASHAYESFIKRYDRDYTLFYIDPPYYDHENDYGKNMFCKEDFYRLEETLASINGKFIMSINNVPEVNEIFKNFHTRIIETAYTVARKGPKRVSENLISNVEFFL